MKHIMRFCVLLILMTGAAGAAAQQDGCGSPCPAERAGVRTILLTPTLPPTPAPTRTESTRPVLIIGAEGASGYAQPDASSERRTLVDVRVPVIGRTEDSLWVQVAYQKGLYWIEISERVVVEGDLSRVRVPRGLATPEALSGTPTVTPAPELIRQWASRAVASSEYSDPSWNAEQATGEPNTEGCGDISTAWASRTATGRDYLTVFYDRVVMPTQIHIHQTYTPGSITFVELIPADGGDPIPVPESSSPSTECPNVFTLTLDMPGLVPIIGVRINLDQRIGGSWNEIDAVELVGLTVE